MRSSCCGTCRSLRLRTFAGFPSQAIGATLMPKRQPSLLMVLQAGAFGRWQRGPTTLALTTLTWGFRLRSSAGGWRAPPPRTGRRWPG
eukprot:11328879-Alexandrium_andersonii.AAC.1